MDLAAAPALWLLVPAAPIALWAALSDLARMRIPNRAVLALAAGFAVVGLLALPLPEYGLRWAQGIVVLALGFAGATLRLFGAGDAKMAAAAAPYVAPGGAFDFAFLLCVATLCAFALHRALRAVPAVRRASPGWTSWSSPKFPFGVPLAAALILHLAGVS